MPTESAASDEHSSAGTGHDDMTAAEQQAWYEAQKEDETPLRGEPRPPESAAPPNWLLPAFVQTLIRRKVITIDPTEAEDCCGLPRDDDGFCIHRPGHPAYVDVTR